MKTVKTFIEFFEGTSVSENIFSYNKIVVLRYLLKRAEVGQILHVFTKQEKILKALAV